MGHGAPQHDSAEHPKIGVGGSLAFWAVIGAAISMLFTDRRTVGHGLLLFLPVAVIVSLIAPSGVPVVLLAALVWTIMRPT